MQAARRCHALYATLSRADSVARAWQAVQAHAGAAGVDGQTSSASEQSGGEVFLATLQHATCVRP